jgi:uncharacterized repeat protein (TIGR02543 family)
VVLYILLVTAGLALSGCEQPVNDSSNLLPYTITFDSRGGSAVQSINADEATAVPKPPDPVKEGYAFTGWFSAASGGTAYAWPHALSADVTMYARWQANSEPPLSRYTITFDSRGGSAVQSITAYLGFLITKPPNPQTP